MKRVTTWRSSARAGAAAHGEGRRSQGAPEPLQATQRYRAGEDIADRSTLLRATPLPPASTHGPVDVGASAVGMLSPAMEPLLTLRRLRRADWTLILAVFGLCAIGLLMVFSVSQAINPNDPWNLLRHQALAAALGVLALTVTARVDYHSWRRLALGGLILALGLVALTLVIGREVNGAQRWLGGAVIGFQPSEPAKLALILFLAHWFARVGPEIRTVRRGLLPFVAATGALAGLTLAQRDMGTTVVIVVVAFAMYFTAGARPSHLVALLALGALALVALALAVSYRRARLSAFLNPLPPGCSDPASYQVCQGLLSLGSAGARGAGLGASVQKAGYLPLPQSDSIYAVLGGELGLLGCALTLGLLAVVIWRGYRAGRRSPDTFGALLACGAATWIATQSVINIGGVVAAVPFTGVPLPFISYGGAALVSALAAVGALLNIHAQGAPLRGAGLASRRPVGSEPLAEPVAEPVTESVTEPARQPTDTELSRQQTTAGTPLATAGHAWTWSGPSSFARKSGEEQQ